MAVDGTGVGGALLGGAGRDPGPAAALPSARDAPWPFASLISIARTTPCPATTGVA
jgi:hypothetical protein